MGQKLTLCTPGFSLLNIIKGKGALLEVVVGIVMEVTSVSCQILGKI